MSAASQGIRRKRRTAKEPFTGLDALVNHCVGRAARRASIRRDFWRLSGEAERLSKIRREESDRVLAEGLEEMRRACRRGISVPLPEAVSLVVEAARRELGLEAHREQIMGALAAHRGFLAEMATGEGKTLTIGLAGALAAWRGRPVHILTANDYLAARDAEWLRPLYARCGVTAGSVLSEMEPPERRANYRCDVTHSTSKEVVADFLRDRLVLGDASNPQRRHLRALLGAKLDHGTVLRGLDTAIVDEADNALIDEAITPLIISREEDNAPLRDACLTAADLARSLRAGLDYTIDAAHQELTVAPEALAQVAAIPASLPGMWRAGHRRLELVRQALVAREFYHHGKHYVIQEGKIVIVDEFTGRLMPDRKWRQGLHQAVEAKEGLSISAPAETLARLSFQRYFRLYRNLSGFSGTAMEEANELWQIYALPIVRIPTHRPCIRQELPDAIFPDHEAKWRAIVSAVERQHREGRPVLVGARTVAASEHLAGLLRQRDLPFSLLNARYHREEAAIVADAGLAGRVTIATNMAGRGTDIKLGPGVADRGGLHVIATERHEARRIDRQLFGRCARQGDPGSAQAFVSLEDELLVRHSAGWLRRTAAAWLDNPAGHRLLRQLVGRAQAASERLASRRRRDVMEMDLQLEESLAFAGDAPLG